jgi:hypothetical protein
MRNINAGFDVPVWVVAHATRASLRAPQLQLASSKVQSATMPQGERAFALFTDLDLAERWVRRNQLPPPAYLELRTREELLGLIGEAWELGFRQVIVDDVSGGIRKCGVSVSTLAAAILEHRSAALPAIP